MIHKVITIADTAVWRTGKVLREQILRVLVTRKTVCFLCFSLNHCYKIEVMSLKYYFFLSSLLQYLKGTSGQQIPLSEKEVIYVQESLRPCPKFKTGSK